ncbi:MAG: hypothetical protein NVSMB10_12600 [Steroidobacteraceae bacterium]
MHRVLTLIFLGLTLLLAGLPASACGSGMASPDCCPTAYGTMSGRHRVAAGAAQALVQSCCTTTSVSTANTATARSAKSDQHLRGAEPSMIAAVDFGGAQPALSGQWAAGWVAPAFRPSGSSLYLHTARLRL